MPVDIWLRVGTRGARESIERAAELLAGDWQQLHRQLDCLIAAGLSKFVIRPLGETPADEFIDRFIDELLPRQN